MSGLASEQRLLNLDGTFNVDRRGFGLRASVSLYHALLCMSWPRFVALLCLLYLVVNLLFSFAYMAGGPDALGGLAEGGSSSFFQCFFFSVHTFSTIGYGHVVPQSLYANLLVTVESMFGLLATALATGLAFARFSRPRADVAFSRRAVVTPRGDGDAFEFRIANMKNTELVEAEVRLIYTWLERGDSELVRHYERLALEAHHAEFFPLSWTLVHCIEEDSPLWGLGQKDLESCGAEFLVLVSATDEAAAQSVHSRYSYRAEDVFFGARFAFIMERGDDGRLSVDLSRLDEIERVEEAATSLGAESG